MPTIKEILNKSDQNKISRLDLEVLLANVLNCRRSFFYSHPEQTLDDKSLKAFKKLITQRKNGKPIAYLTKTKEFFGHSLYIDERVLIPRPETEMIVEEAQTFKKSTELKIIDIGCGSGAIGIALAKYYPNSHVTLLDICNEALEVAEINVRNQNISERTTILHSDLLSEIPENSHIDLFAANLPYIGETDFISAETKKYEPAKALYAGQDGLDLYRKLFAQIKSRKIKFKLFIGEFGYSQKKLIEKELNKYFNDFEIKNDLSGIPRIFIIKDNGRKIG